MRCRCSTSASSAHNRPGESGREGQPGGAKPGNQRAGMLILRTPCPVGPLGRELPANLSDARLLFLRCRPVRRRRGRRRCSFGHTHDRPSQLRHGPAKSQELHCMRSRHSLTGRWICLDRRSRGIYSERLSGGSYSDRPMYVGLNLYTGCSRPMTTHTHITKSKNEVHRGWAACCGAGAIPPCVTPNRRPASRLSLSWAGAFWWRQLGHRLRHSGVVSESTTGSKAA